MIKEYSKPCAVSYSQPPLPMVAYTWFNYPSFGSPASISIMAAIKHIQAMARKLMT